MRAKGATKQSFVFDKQNERKMELPWYHAWLMAVTQPSSQTFEKISQQIQVSFRRVYDWAFIGNWGFAVVLLVFGGTSYIEYSEGSPLLVISSAVLTIGTAIFLTAIFLLTGFMLLGMLTHLMARLFGGKGTREQLMYAMAAYWAPLGLISGILSLIPLVRYMVFGLLIYGVILNTIATKAVHQFGWGKAIASNFIMLFPLCYCGMIPYLVP